MGTLFHHKIFTIEKGIGWRTVVPGVMTKRCHLYLTSNTVSEGSFVIRKVFVERNEYKGLYRGCDF